MMYDDDGIWPPVINRDSIDAETERVYGKPDSPVIITRDIKLSTAELGKEFCIGDNNLGMKYDSGKLLWGCYTKGLAYVIRGVVAVLTYGAQKYAADSWQTVPNGLSRYRDALDRHWNAYNSGEHFDSESGLHHMLHVICNAMFVMWFIMQEMGNEKDFIKFNKVEKK